ncbi:MAG: undecaprenyl/decaprenyl-phosphate alpha-N-acetylglucosaminyl 1-phosphate transferase [Deltaproteobacteria bacterium]|nr:undecaprenyl/decaprenyl-phosphate alpha-N-acetylglucosaminyl 1-phosphate transferase [Deltaproteobacteria bacterium]
MVFLATLFISLFTSIILIPIVRSLAIRLNAVDAPDPRKVHTCPMPKSGGIAMACGAVIPVLLWLPMDHFVRAVLLGSAIVVVFGAVDDFVNLSYKPKFASQVAAALVVILWGGVEISSLGTLLPPGLSLPHWLAVPLTVVVIVGATNAINLSDGLDGLAGGISILIFLCIAYLAHRVGDTEVALFALAVSGAVFGFLRFNTYPADLFMGDAGSQMLGFLAVTLSIKLTQGLTGLSPLLPLLLLGFPILDTLTVMTERMAAGKSPFVADKNHFHHKLMRLGFVHKEAVLVIYVVQSLLVSSAFLLRHHPDGALLGFYALFSGLIVTGFIVAERKGWKVPRYDIVEHFVRTRLRPLREKQLVIRVSHAVLENGLPLLLLVSCMIPARLPAFVPWMAAGFMVPVLFAWRFRPVWLGTVLRTTLYLLIPYVVYFGELEPFSWMGNGLGHVYCGLFTVMAASVLLTLKFTRRRKGFKTTPMDFLILFVVLVVPNLPDARIQGQALGLVATKMIAFFFSYEVLNGELRGEYGKLARFTVATLLLLAARGVVGL